MELKKLRLLSLIGLLTFSLFLVMVLIPPLNLDIEIEKKDVYIEAFETFDLIFKHERSSHPFLDPLAISSVRLFNEETTLSLTILNTQNDLYSDGTTLTTVRFDSPFSEISTPFVIEDATLEIMATDQILSFELGTFGFFSQTPIHTENVQILYGFYEADKASLNGIYIRLKNDGLSSIKEIKIGNQLIDLNTVRLTSMAYDQGLNIKDYEILNSSLSELDTINLIIPFTNKNTLEKIPISLYFEAKWDTFHVYIPPFQFIKSIPFLEESEVVKGVFHD